MYYECIHDLYTLQVICVTHVVHETCQAQICILQWSMNEAEVSCTATGAWQVLGSVHKLI